MPGNHISQAVLPSMRGLERDSPHALLWHTPGVHAVLHHWIFGRHYEGTTLLQQHMNMSLKPRIIMFLV